jgi:hypothetical protein
MSFSTVTIGSSATVIAVDARTIPKVVYLPTVSTNQGRLLILKDYYGVANNSTITASTTGTDLIDDINWSAAMRSSFMTMALLSDGQRSWRLTGLYTGGLTPSPPPSGLPLTPDVRYSFLSTNYPGSGTVNNIGSNSGIGAATVVRQSYTASTPGFITIANDVSQYVQAPTQTGIRTIIMIVRVTNAGGNTYLLDARNGLPNGWMWNGGTGADWVGQTYYRDCILTTMPGNVPGNLQDSQWHHACFIRAAFTDDVTYLARISQNESVGADCAEIMVFTQALTLQQVKDNFNFFASRFGWTPVA